MAQTAHEALLRTRGQKSPARAALAAWYDECLTANRQRYGSHLYAPPGQGAAAVSAVPASYAPEPEMRNGFEILNECFDAAFQRMPQLIALGEDVGQLGDVNQGFANLQGKYGDLRLSDTGIRETTIVGQAIGMAIRGLRPIAEIQYLDYILYALQIMSDDLATLRWRTAGGQKSPVLLRTRGHRLEGIWHSGSPMAGVIHLIRGIHVCVPRNAVQAAGFYNTLLAQDDDPALVVEVLNGYRRKEPMPTNIDTTRVPLGVPEVLRPGRDVTILTYGACCEIAAVACERLAEIGIEVELIDAQTLLPFDVDSRVAASVRKTNRVLFLDEDVPGGCTSYLMQQVLERDEAFAWLDSPPVTLTARAHRPPYGSDGDYFSKPNVEDVVRSVYGLLHESEPDAYPDYLG